MSSTVNKVILVGRLGKDPEIRQTSGGQSVANFSLATDESYKDKSGERQKKVEWHSIVVWGKSVEAFVQPYLHKGDLVYIEGKLQTRSWDDKTSGQKKYTTEINVSDIKALSTGDGSAQPAAASRNSGARSTSARPTTRNTMAAAEAETNLPEISDEDIPF